MNDYIPQDLYLANLCYDITKDDLLEMLEQFGPVKETNLIEKKGIAYVTYEHIEDAELALKCLDEIDFLGRKLFLDWAKPRKTAIRKVG